jgi:hypothetical protein
VSGSAASATDVATKKDKDCTVIVNGEARIVEDEDVSYDEVAKLAYPTPPFADTMFTVTYRNAKKPKEGTLVDGQSVEVKKDGTIFNVKATDRS